MGIYRWWKIRRRRRRNRVEKNGGPGHWLKAKMPLFGFNEKSRDLKAELRDWFTHGKTKQKSMNVHKLQSHAANIGGAMFCFCCSVQQDAFSFAFPLLVNFYMNFHFSNPFFVCLYKTLWLFPFPCVRTNKFWGLKQRSVKLEHKCMSIKFVGFEMMLLF